MNGLSTQVGMIVAAGDLSPAAAYRAAVMADSPVAYWRLGEASGTVAIDEVGSYGGTHVGAPTLGAAGPMAGATAINYPATAQNTTLPGIPIGTGDHTISLFVYLPDTTNRRDLFSRKNLATGANDLVIYYTGSKFALFERASSPGASVGVTGATTPPSAGWYHIAATRIGTAKKIYVNGAIDGSATATADNLGSESGVLSQNKSGTFPLQSRMCEVAVFTAGLSPARIAAHYAASGL